MIEEDICGPPLREREREREGGGADLEDKIAMLSRRTEIQAQDFSVLNPCLSLFKELETNTNKKIELFFLSETAQR